MILLVGCFFIPESPRYYVLKGRPEDARVALARLRGQAQDSEFVNTEMAEMEANHACVPSPSLYTASTDEV